MTLPEEGYSMWSLRWSEAVDEAKMDAPAGFEFIGFLWGHDFTHGPFLATEDKPGPTVQAIYARVEQ